MLGDSEAATLGLIDVAYTQPAGARLDFTGMWGGDDLAYLSRYDGLQYFRLTPARGVLPGTCPRLRAGNGGIVHASDRHAQSPGARQRAADGRRAAGVGDVRQRRSRWRLARDKTLAAIESGHKADDLRAFLGARDEQPLPELVDGFLRNVERGAQAIKPRGTALLFECVDEKVADRLVADQRTSKPVPAGREEASGGS